MPPLLEIQPRVHTDKIVKPVVEEALIYERKELPSERRNGVHSQLRQNDKSLFVDVFNKEKIFK